MACIVMKFGGTSVADMVRIKSVAARVAAEVAAGHSVVVVVSAMAGTTNRLIELSREAGAVHDAREYDAIVATGEQVSCGLLAIALQNMGVDARSWTGWQIPIITDGVHGGARIERIEVGVLKERLAQNQVAVVAGFQGMAGETGRITTFGRGGSDISAVAMAAALGAERCDIYTDVEGVYTADPRIVDTARKLESITSEEMLELASGGAKVLQTRSVAMAMRHGVDVQVRSSLVDAPGTMVFADNTKQAETDDMEKNPISGIAYSSDEAKITLAGLEDRPGIAAAVFSALAEQNINVDMIVQSAASGEGSEGEKTDITFSLPAAELVRAKAVLESIRGEVPYAKMLATEHVSKVSVIGMAMRSQPGVARKVFATLAEKGINIEVISTSEIKISVLIDREYTELAIRALHSAFGLDAEGAA